MLLSGTSLKQMKYLYRSQNYWTFEKNEDNLIKLIKITRDILWQIVDSKDKCFLDFSIFQHQFSKLFQLIEKCHKTVGMFCDCQKPHSNTFCHLTSPIAHLPQPIYINIPARNIEFSILMLYWIPLAPSILCPIIGIFNPLPITWWEKVASHH